MEAFVGDTPPDSRQGPDTGRFGNGCFTQAAWSPFGKPGQFRT